MSNTTQIPPQVLDMDAVFDCMKQPKKRMAKDATLRELIAISAMQAIIIATKDGAYFEQAVAENSYKMADKMLKVGGES